MDAEFLGTGSHQLGVSLGHLILTHAVLGVAGVIHDAVAQLKHTARVKAAADGLGHACDLFQELHMSQIVEVDVSAQVVGFLHVLGRGVVGGKHDIAALEAAGLAHQQLGIAGAVDTTAFLLQDFQQVGVWGRLDGKVFLEAFVPAERGVDLAGVLADAFFVIEVEGRGNIGGNLFRLGKGDKRLFLRHDSLSFPCIYFQIMFIIYVLGQNGKGYTEKDRSDSERSCNFGFTALSPRGCPGCAAWQPTGDCRAGGRSSGRPGTGTGRPPPTQRGWPARRRSTRGWAPG